MTTAPARLYRVLGVNDEANYCECCGKRNLKKVVWIENTETGKIQHFGTVCALNPQKAMNVDVQLKVALQLWDNTLQRNARVARDKYMEQGGRFVSNGIPLRFKGGALIPADQALYAKCAAEVRAMFALPKHLKSA